jgi:uncharacterized protein (DUF1501 family)
MAMTRRSLLRDAALAAAGGAAPWPGLRGVLFAAQPDPGRILVLLHLRGGCDGLNLLSPASDADFIAARNSDLRVLSEGQDAGHAIVHSQSPGTEFRLHAAAGALADLYDAKHLAFVHAAGLSNATRSHFAATDMIEHGVADGASLNRTASGWLARAVEQAPARAGGGILHDRAVRAVSTSSAPSGVWTGDADAISIADLANGLSPPGGVQTANVLRRLYGATPATAAAAWAAPASAGRITLDAMSAIDSRLARDPRGKYLAYVPQLGSNYDSAYELGRPLKTLAQLIKLDLGLQAATVDLGGWDTHEYQPGRFRNQVERLSQGLGTFYNDLARYQDRVVVVVVTEFGRRLRSNRSNGTDHGRGSVMLVLGGKVAGGSIRGRWPGLSAEQLDEGVDLAVANDYRQVFSEVVEHWREPTRASAAVREPMAARDIFPGYAAATPLGLFQSS